MFRPTAERAYARFRVGDQFVASGYINEYELEKHGHVEAREEFVARRIGHDVAHHATTSTAHRRGSPTHRVRI